MAEENFDAYIDYLRQNSRKFRHKTPIIMNTTPEFLNPNKRNVLYINSNQENGDESNNFNVLNKNKRNLFENEIKQKEAQEGFEGISLNGNSNNSDNNSFRENARMENIGKNNVISDKTDTKNTATKAEKTTYCRPVLNMNNQDFIYKTMERNAKLQKLVNRLVLVRQREKKREAWNNYINELKNKHRYYPKSMNIHDIQDITDDEIMDYYNTKFSWKVSDPCQNLLDEIYSVSSEFHPNNNKRYGSTIPPYSFGKNRTCYPTASQGLIIMNRAYKRYDDNQLRRLYGNKIVCHRELGTKFKNNREYDTKNTNSLRHERDNFVHINHNYCQCNKIIEKQTQSTQDSINTFLIKNLAIQTDSLYNKNVDDNNEKIIEENNQIISNDEHQLKRPVKSCTFTNIENKIDTLIQSINEFIKDMKSNRNGTSCKNAGITCHYDGSNIKLSENEAIDMLRKEIICGIVNQRPQSDVNFDKIKNKLTIEDILYEELHKSNRAKKDIEEILEKSDQECAAQYSFDEPTKERSTEVTDSLCNSDKSITVECSKANENGPMTVAVNTEPLGVLALLRVSTETIKHLLSFMPQIDYISYLTRLQLPNSSQTPIFSCNICGAVFDKPTRLSDHIEQHKLGNTRNCCVCRHVVDMKNNLVHLYACRHCGQRFTRAYCRVLHEQDCGMLLGKKQTISSSHIDLK